MREILKGVHNRHGEDLYIEIMDDTKSFYRTIEFKLKKNSCTVTSHCSFQVRNMKSQKGFVIELEQIDASDTFEGYGTILLENALKELLLEFDCDLVINGKIWIASPTSEDKLRHFYSKFFTVKENHFRSEFKINNRIKDIEALNDLIEKERTTKFNREIDKLNSTINTLTNEIELLKEVSILKFWIIKRKHKKLKKISYSLRQLSKNDKR